MEEAPATSGIVNGNGTPSDSSMFGKPSECSFPFWILLLIGGFILFGDK